MGVTVGRVLSDNGACHRSRLHAVACSELGIRHLFTRPYRPRTNGKAERFIQTLTYRRAYSAIQARRRSGPRRCPAGSTTTTSGDDTAPSVTGRPRLGSPSWNNLVRNYS
jgi:transposase InsO family protein